MTQSQLPTRKGFLSLLLALVLSGMAIAVGYVWVLLSDGSLPKVLIQYFAGVTVLLLFLTPLAGWWSSRTLMRLRNALMNEVAPEDLDPRDVKKVLKLPRWVFFTQSGLLLLVLLPVVVYVAGWSPDALSHVVIVAGVASLMQGVVGYYACTLYVRGKVCPVLLASGSFAHLEPLRLSQSWHHVAALIVLLGAVLPACFIQMLTASEPRVELVAFLTLHFLAVGLLVGWAVIRAVMGPVRVLHDHMQEVAKGRLDQRAPIQALDTMGALSAHFNTMVEGLEQRERIRQIFGRYVARQVAERILAGQIELGGERRTATVLFADIRGFTSISERMNPEDVVNFLNAYFEVMVGCVIQHGGVLDKFIGDCIMALFGVPVSENGAAADARSAVACAQDMREQLIALNARRVAAGSPAIDMGIGIHTGELVAGNIGTPERMEYTVVGDTVNVSSRLEQLTKDFQRPILISRTTAELLSDETPLEEISTVEVRGRKQPITVFSVGE